MAGPLTSLYESGNSPSSGSRTAPRGAFYTMLAMLGFALMDTMSKWLVVDYPSAR